MIHYSLTKLGAHPAHWLTCKYNIFKFLCCSKAADYERIVLGRLDDLLHHLNFMLNIEDYIKCVNEGVGKRLPYKKHMGNILNNSAHSDPAGNARLV